MSGSNPAGDLKLEDVSIGELEPVTLSIATGEVVCISGASGSGKTRLLRAVADLEPHGGDCLLGDIRQSETPAHRWRARVMMIPAESQWWHETVGEHFDADDAPGDALEALDLPGEAMSWSIDRLSSGEKQRLALIRALARGPQALLLDDPTANLDAESIQRVSNRHLRIRDGRLQES